MKEDTLDSYKDAWLKKKKTLNQAITQPTSARTTSSMYFQTLAMPNAPYCQKYFFPMEGE